MTAPHTKCQPEAAAPYQHVCPEADCIYYGQPTNGGMCGCHRTREQMMHARIEELTKALEEIRDHPAKYDDGKRSYAVGWAFWNLQNRARRALVPSLERSGGAT